jgi:hypothetical protein
MGLTDNQLVTFDPFLSLSSPKRDYRKGEDVIVVVALANFTQWRLVVNKRLRTMLYRMHKYREIYELQFEVIGPNGMPLAQLDFMDRMPPLPGAEDFAELLPTGRWEQEVRLGEYFDFSEKGRYQVTVEYHNDHDGHQFGVDAWIGKLRSSSIEVVIQEANERPPAGALPQAPSRGEHRATVDDQLLQFVLAGVLASHLRSIDIVAYLSPQQVVREEFPPGEINYDLIGDDLRPSDIIQSWWVFDGSLSECSPGRYLECKAMPKTKYLEFSVLEQEGAVYVVWETAIVWEEVRIITGGCGGFDVLRKVDGQWTQMPDETGFWRS